MRERRCTACQAREQGVRLDDSASAFKKAFRLHTRQAGFGSLRDLEDRTGLAHTTISHAFNLERSLPSERTVYVIVQATKGDQEFWRDELEAAGRATMPAAAPEEADSVESDSVTTTPFVGNAEERAPGGRGITKAAVGLVALTAGVLIVISSDSSGRFTSAGEGRSISRGTPSTSAGAGAWLDETAIPDNAVRTIGNPVTGGGLGAYIEPSQTVQVSCRVYSPVIPSALPDGFFYRIESSPWNGRFYAAANSFLNGDPPGDPAKYVTPTDLAVPICDADG